ncbi:MAG: ornithine carbamoyltransferase [Thaumarchaeota archaeon]|jgi:ornithine carbamoyltransferase|nr:ornithine carbamoyltransferase [Candidatus Terraquivivens yellowstonensis]MCL7398409.1 ornithine carbamoyltransferase [Candidatus Terraquivivens yellowstonensis]MCL7400222.1 ornithine carbamoyltransferase [Candidatus Terraquivivens yellowstonensis]
MVRHFLDFEGYAAEEVLYILDMAINFKKKGYPDSKPLSGKSIALIFEKPSTRTRVSFQVAIAKLGGESIPLSVSEMQLSRGEPISDTMRVLSDYVNAVVARVYKHEMLSEMVKYSSVPVINALSDKFHPCQALADMMTIKELKGNIYGVKVAYVGDGNNVCNSLIQACSLLGARISVASPKEYQPPEDVVAQAKEWGKRSGGTIELTEDPEDAVRDADVVYTDVFVSMGQEDERERRLKVFYPKYKVTERLMSLAKPDAIFMHCLPAHRGEEVEASVIDGKRSAVWQQAANRLHTEAALLLYLLQDGKKFNPSLSV